jgi:hypothetical protein
VTALRYSKSEGIRLLGHAKITREEILRSAESNLCRCSVTSLIIVPQNYIVAFELELNRVNPDGPSLTFSVRSSVSKVWHREMPGLNLINMPENTSEVVDISCRTII